MDNSAELPRLSRLTSLLVLLQTKRLITAREIAERYQISMRTAYRDLKALEAAGIPLFVEEGKGYSLIEGFSLPPIMFTEEEANALITAGKIVAKNSDSSLINQYQTALLKIRAVLKYSGKTKTALLNERIAYVQTTRRDAMSNYISTIQIALTNFKLLKIQYKTLYKHEISERIIEPLALYNTHDYWIHIAWCRLRYDFREFRLDRIMTIELLKDHFEDRKFKLIDYFKEKISKNKLDP